MRRFWGAGVFALSLTIPWAAMPDPAGAGPMSGGVVAAASEAQSVSHGYWFTLQGVSFVGTWDIGGSTYSFAAASPVVVLGTGDLATGSVEAFDVTGTGASGAMSATCPLGPASFSSLGGTAISASFTTDCVATVNGGPTEPLVLSATVSLLPDEIVSSDEAAASTVSPPTGGTFST